jgi:hypothetical protein
VGFGQGGAPTNGNIGKPLANLPGHVKAAEGELTLFADFKAKGEKSVPIYIVNRTDKPVKFYHQDGFLFVMLEYEAKPGWWVRAQSHVFSWCGNSYYGTPELAGDTFAVVHGYAPDEGTKSKVRYSFYQQKFKVSSNHGDGLVSKAEIERAATDVLAAKTKTFDFGGDFDFARRIATGAIRREAKGQKLEDQTIGDVDWRAAAIDRLGSGVFDRQRSVEVLQSIAAGDDQVYADRAKQAMKRLRDAERKKGAK